MTATNQLDSLLMRLQQLTPADRPGLDEVREGLLAAACNPGVPDSARSLAAEALLSLDQALAAQVAAKSRKLLRRCAGLLERAAAAAGSTLTESPAHRTLQPPMVPSLNPDDLLARLMQLSPQDRPELEGIRGELQQLSRDETQPHGVRQLFAAAVLKLDELLYTDGPDPERLNDAIRLAGRAVEEAEVPAGPTQLPANRPSPQGAGPSTANPEAVSVAAAGPFLTELPPDADTDLLEEFVSESLELIEAAETALLALEVEPADRESVHTVFRAFHTVKGTSGFLGMTPIKELAHLAENLLSRIRDGKIRYSGGYADLALKAVDLLKELICQVQKALSGQPMRKPKDYDRLLENLANPDSVETQAETPSAVPLPRLGDLLVSQGAVDRDVIEDLAREAGSGRLGESLVKAGIASASEVARGLRAQRALAEAQAIADQNVRVRTDRLDRLIDMVGELVIAHAMVSQDETIQNGRNQELVRKIAQTGKIVRELQDLSMSLRMVPLKPAFQKVQRLVRDLASKAGKKVRLQTFGEDTEIDRNMVDVLKDPLVHMVRNAVDHGIEPPDERAAAGKSEEGLITLSACHSGGSVVVELGDDGRGLNRQKIIEKAVAHGVIDSASGMSEQEIFSLIFRAGFSTAEHVTEVSGRGVGMDVVRRNIEAIRGRIEMTSDVGRGSKFRIILPLTMAVTDGMLVRVGEERYIIPTVSIVKTLRPEQSQVSTISGKAEMVLLRGELLPMFRLSRLLGVSGAREDPAQALLVILAAGETRYGLMVDELQGQHQLVAKSLGNGIGKVLGISGAAILGDGRVGLILDALELNQLARQEGISSAAGDATPELAPLAGQFM